jgi:hypothetical protein
VSRDIQVLREESTKAMKIYLENLPIEHQKARSAVDLILKKSFETLDSKDIELSDSIDIMKLILQATQIRLSFLTDATVLTKALQNTESLKQELYKLKKEKATNATQKPIYEVIQLTDEDGNKVRQARKIKKSKGDPEVIV